MLDLLLALDFVSSDGGGVNEAFLCRRTGKVYWRSPDLDDVEELPDDLEESQNYIAIPAKRELDLGKSLVLDFAAKCMPDDHYDKVRRIFGGRGAYRNFKMLLEDKGKLKEWYDFEAQATERALRVWCKENSIEITS